MRLLTWDTVKAEIAEAGIAGISNRELAMRFTNDLGRPRLQDVTLLTRLMWIAGEVNRDFDPTKTGNPPARYTLLKPVADVRGEDPFLIRDM